MNERLDKRVVPRLCLDAETAADLMVSNPIPLASDATVKEAVVFLAENNLHAAPVIDQVGRLVGILSQSDIVDKAGYLATRPDYYDAAKLDVRLENECDVPRDVHAVARLPIRDIMAQDVVAVALDAPVEKVVDEMLHRRVHQLFVVGPDRTLTGVISYSDILKHLAPSQPKASRTRTRKKNTW